MLEESVELNKEYSIMLRRDMNIKSILDYSYIHNPLALQILI